MFHESMSLVFFYESVFLVGYTYLLYPLLLMVLASAKRTPVMKKEITPLVSIVIPAYNEEKAIAEKITNVLGLDYPPAQREIVVVSDCSSDRTDEIVRTFEDRQVRLHRMKDRGGKIAGYCDVLPTLKGEIVIFTDATSRLEADSLKKLISNFADEHVGCVGGRLRYVDPKRSQVAKGEQAYWSYETRVKKWEEKVASLTSVSGTFYGVRKDLFPKSMPKDLADDLIVVLTCVKKGKRVVYEQEAVCEEFAVHDARVEFTKRSRITIQNVRGLLYMPQMLDFFKYGWYAVMLISHKFLRILSPFLLIAILWSNYHLLDVSIYYRIIFDLQLVFYVLGLLACFLRKRPKVLNIIFYFCLTQLSILWGVLKMIFGAKVTTWETQRS